MSLQDCRQLVPRLYSCAHLGEHHCGVRDMLERVEPDGTRGRLEQRYLQQEARKRLVPWPSCNGMAVAASIRFPIRLRHFPVRRRLRCWCRGQQPLQPQHAEDAFPPQVPTPPSADDEVSRARCCGRQCLGEVEEEGRGELGAARCRGRVGVCWGGGEGL